MSIQYSSRSKPNNERSIRTTCITELEKLIKYARTKRISVAMLVRNGLVLPHLELWILDSAFKNISLERTDKTLLILPNQYITLLQNLIISIAQKLTSI